MNKKILITVVLLATMTVAKAQWQVGLTAGYSLNAMSTDTRYAYDLNYESRGGVAIGIPVAYSFNDWFALRADAQFVQKNFKMHRSGVFEGFRYKQLNSYFSLPVVAQFSFGGKRLRGFVNGGGYLGYWLSAHRKGITCNIDETGEDNGYYLNDKNIVAYSEKVDFDSRRDNRFDAGVTAGAGVEYRLTPLIGLTAEVRHYYGLTNMYKNTTVGDPRYNTTWTFQAGCMIHLDKKNNKKKGQKQ